MKAAILIIILLTILLGISVIMLPETKIVIKGHALNPCDYASSSYYTNSSGKYTSQNSECNQYFFPKDKSGHSDYSYSNPSQKPGNNAQDIIAANGPLLGKRPFVSTVPNPSYGKSSSLPTSVDTSSSTGPGQYFRQKWAEFDAYVATLTPYWRQSYIEKFGLELQRQLSDVPIEDRSAMVNRMKADMPPRLAQAVTPYLLPVLPSETKDNPRTDNPSISGSTSNFPRTPNSSNAPSNDDVGSTLNTADQWIKRGKHLSSCGIGDLACTISPP